MAVCGLEMFEADTLNLIPLGKYLAIFHFWEDIVLISYNTRLLDKKII